MLYSVAIIAAIILLELLVVKVLVTASESQRLKILKRYLNIAIVPLLVVFCVIFTVLTIIIDATETLYSVDIIVAIILLELLALKVLVTASENQQLKPLNRYLNIIIVPLLVVFGVILLRNLM